MTFKKFSETPLRSLTIKLTLAFLLVSLTGIALVAVLVGVVTSSEFNRFVLARGLNDYYSAASTYYKAHGSWAGVAEALQSQGLVPQSTSSPGKPPDGDQPNGARVINGPNGPNETPFGNAPIDHHGPPPVPFVLVDQNSQVIFLPGRSKPARCFPRASSLNEKRLKPTTRRWGTWSSPAGRPT